MDNKAEEAKLGENQVALTGIQVHTLGAKLEISLVEVCCVLTRDPNSADIAVQLTDRQRPDFWCEVVTCGGGLKGRPSGPLLVEGHYPGATCVFSAKIKTSGGETWLGVAIEQGSGRNRGTLLVMLAIPSAQTKTDAAVSMPLVITELLLRVSSVFYYRLQQLQV